MDLTEILNRHPAFTEIAPDTVASINHRFLNAPDDQVPQKSGCFKSISDSTRNAMVPVQNEIARQSREHLVFFDQQGRILRRTTGSRGRVRVEMTPDLLGMPCLHNHPEGLPPSAEDVFEMVVYEIPLARIVTPSGMVFDLGPAQNSIGHLKMNYRFLDEVTWAVAEETIRTEGMKITENERYFRRQHALLAELADRNLLCYARF